MKGEKKILYQSKKDIPIMKVIMILTGLIMIAFSIYLILFYGISVFTVLATICLIIFGIGLSYEGIKNTTQNVRIKGENIEIIPNQFFTKNNRSIETIQRDELLRIRTDGSILKFIIKDRMIDDYQKQDEIHMKTSSWRKARKLRQEMKDFMNRT